MHDTDISLAANLVMMRTLLMLLYEDRFNRNEKPREAAAKYAEYVQSRIEQITALLGPDAAAGLSLEAQFADFFRELQTKLTEYRPSQPNS